MTLYNNRLCHVLSALCLAVALGACNESPTPAPALATRGPAAAATDTPAGAPPSPTATPEAREPVTSSPTPASEAQEPPTDTPTPTAGPLPVATTPAVSRCAGLTGRLEIQVLVGPAEAVGLEPVAVGSVPLAVTASEPPWLVEGQGPVSYEETLEQQWGTYAVTMDMDMAVQGECSGQAGGEQLDLVLEMAGEQLVVVDAGRFRGEYPWSGTQSFNLLFPLEEGATAEGEGWNIVLHLERP